MQIKGYIFTEEDKKIKATNIPETKIFKANNYEEAQDFMNQIKKVMPETTGYLYILKEENEDG